ncbi:MAG TPA: glycosyltransferase family 4 protein [Terriglobia bacterium]|nr:glycosyltransferase family 4 protein [Terriglobia bacterium]
MTRRYQVLVVTNLWPSEADPSYGAAIRAQMESLHNFGVDYEVVFVKGRESKLNYLRCIFEVRRRVAAKKYDVIYAHFGLSGWVARFQWKVPVVVKFMGDDVLGQFDWRGRITLMGRFYMISSVILARFLEGAIVMSREMKQKLRRQDACIMPPGVNLEVFKPLDRDECRKTLGLDPGKKYVFFPYDPAVARKRFDLVQEGVRLARAQVPELEILQVAGIAQDRLPVYYNAADMLLLPSQAEGSPNAVKEAMAVNLPVICAEVGDARELIGPTEGCYIVPREAPVIAQKIVEVCRRNARTNGREWIAKWSLAGAASKVLGVFDQAMARH